MDDLNAFERQIGGQLTGFVGPVRLVDDAAIFAAVTSSQSPRWRVQPMFSATKFVVAGAIVALFGGFLLAGVLTQPSDDMTPAAVTASPSPMSTEELLSGMLTEEVEPGLYRLLEDGAGLSASYVDHSVRLSVAPSGQLVLGVSDDIPGQGAELRVVGTDERILLPAIRGLNELAYGPDGTLWAIGWSGVASLVDHGEWRVTDGTPVGFDTMTGGQGLALLEVAPADLRIVTLDPVSGWASEVPYPSDLLGDPRWGDDGPPADVAHGAGALWVGFGGVDDGGLARLEDGADPTDGWTLPEPLGEGVAFGTLALAVGPEDTLWALLMVNTGDHVRFGGSGITGPCCQPVLARYRNGSWVTWTTDDGLPFGNVTTWPYPAHWIAMEVAPDGTVWMGGTDGPASFDGQTFEWHGQRINPGGWTGAGGLTVAPDGSAWVVVTSEGRTGGPSSDSVYVITPEATRTGDGE